MVVNCITKLYGKNLPFNDAQNDIFNAVTDIDHRKIMLNTTRGCGFTTFMVNWSFGLASTGYDVSYFVASKHDISEINKRLSDFYDHAASEMIGGSNEVNCGILNVEHSVRDCLKVSCGYGCVTFYVANVHNLVGKDFMKSVVIFDSADFYDNSLAFFGCITPTIFADKVILASTPNPNVKYHESWFQKMWLSEGTQFKKYYINYAPSIVSDASCGFSDKFYDFYFNNAREYFSRLLKELNNNNTNENKPMKEHVNHPEHYNLHPSGVECIEIAKHYDFCIGNAIKYLWRCGLKSEEGMTDGEKEIEDLEKAVWYINERIRTLKEAGE